jgi:hypothetical protein
MSATLTAAYHVALSSKADDDDLFCRPSDCLPIAYAAGQGVYVALVIAQTTKRNKVGPIQLPALSQALQKLAPVAKALKGKCAHMLVCALRHTLTEGAFLLCV